MDVKVFGTGGLVVVSTDGQTGGDTREVYKSGDLGVSVEISGGNIPTSGTLELFRKSDGVVLYSMTEVTGSVENQSHTTLEDLYQLVVVAVNN